jgi:tRNA dimethylallyltransferase
MALASRFGGTVINADAMQCYAEMRILTARPSPEDEARVPHALYGVRPVAETVTVAWWREAALAAITSSALPVLCGGSFMYLDALLNGLADIPDPGPAARERARILLAQIGPHALHTRLAERDPATAARLRPSDSQRLARAWEVLDGTGTGLAAWQDQGRNRGRADDVTLTPLVFLLNPDRSALRAAIGARFDAMLAEGVAREVSDLVALGLPADAPALRAHGVPELSAWLRGEVTLADARDRAVLSIGQYTRRQTTWMRHRTLAPPEQVVKINARFTPSEQLPCNIIAGMTQFLSGSG